MQMKMGMFVHRELINLIQEQPGNCGAAAAAAHLIICFSLLIIITRLAFRIAANICSSLA